MSAPFAKKTNSKSKKSTGIKKIKITSMEKQRVSTPREKQGMAGQKKFEIKESNFYKVLFYENFMF